MQPRVHNVPNTVIPLTSSLTFVGNIDVNVVRTHVTQLQHIAGESYQTIGGAGECGCGGFRIPDDGYGV